MSGLTFDPSSIDPGVFMAGVQVFDQILCELDRAASDSRIAGTLYIDAAVREADRETALQLHALPLLRRLVETPALATGFAAALGDYVGALQEGVVPGPGPQYAHLTFERVCWWSEPGRRAGSTVVPFTSIAARKEARHG